MRRLRVGLHGFAQHPWRSVERTRGFYLAALEPAFDLVHLDAPHAPPGVDAVLSFSGGESFEAAARADVPYLFAVHGGAILNHEWLRARATGLRSSDTFIVNCRSDETLLRSLFAGTAPRFCVLPLPAHGECFELIEREEAREQLPFGEPPDLVLGYVARLLPQKNFHHFLAMLKSVVDRFAPRRVDAVVVGEYWIDYPVLPYVTSHDYRDYVTQIASTLQLTDHIVYLGGQLSDADLQLAYASMDVLIHPTCSLDENFGYVPVEAMARGVPVVGAAYGGLKDTIVDGGTGYLMPTWATASGLRMDLLRGTEDTARLLADTELRRRMASDARARAAEQYSAARCGDQLVAAVHAAVGAHRDLVPLVATAAADPLQAGVYLPTVELGWERYWRQAEVYASGPPPALERDTRLRLAAPATFEEDTLWLIDPAWPARFELSRDEREVCLASQSVTRVGDLGVSPAVISSLISRGVLIASNARA